MHFSFGGDPELLAGVSERHKMVNRFAQLNSAKRPKLVQKER